MNTKGSMEARKKTMHAALLFAALIAAAVLRFRGLAFGLDTAEGFGGLYAQNRPKGSGGFTRSDVVSPGMSVDGFSQSVRIIASPSNASG